MSSKSNISELRNELAETRARLAEMEEALDAIRNGEVDGLVMAGPAGQQVFTLEGAQEPYRLLIEHMSEGALTLSAQGVILYANRTFADLLQRPLQGVIGMEFRSLVAASDQITLTRLLAEAQTGTSRGEVTVCALDNSLIPLRLGLSLIDVESQSLISVVATDLSETRQKEAELRSFSEDLERRVSERTADLAASRLAALNMMEDAVAAREVTERNQAELARLGAAVEQTADSIVITDIDGNIKYVNPAFERISGYSKEEVLNKNPRILKSGKTNPDVYKDLWETITRGEVWTGQLINQKKNGTLYEERASISAVYDESHSIVNYVAVKQDISHLIGLEEQLRQSQKMEAVGQLAGGVAHDFNNLLTAINGYSALSLRLVDEGHPIKGYLEEIKKAGDRAANLTRQLLAFGRKQILQPVSVSLNDVVADLNKMLRRLIGEDIQLTAKFDPALKMVKADPGQIEQVIVNLVVNARDAMPMGGILTLETSNLEVDPQYASKYVGLQPGSYVMLSVIDTGTGITADVMAHVFEPFFTTKEKGKGTGLGLSTVYGIVKQSGGNIWIESEPGQGTTFKVCLPQVAVADKPVARSRAEAAVPGGSETILLVEDEDVVRGVAKKVLEQAGYNVLDASGGEDAIRLSQSYAKPIDLLLTDVVMPQLSGKEVAERLVELRPSTRVLFMSGYTDETIVDHGVLDSSVEFIQKPFSPTSLARKVRAVLDSTS